MFIVIVGLFLPRIVTIISYYFTSWINGVFTTWDWPLLGFIFMPYTLLWYSAVINWYGGVWGLLQIVVMVIAILFDLSSWDSA